jgi:hypothetical protein
MSYLGLPRLIFAGQFQADPSTVNNDPEHFDSAAFKARYQQPGQNNGWWNPSGRGTWSFEGCTVQQVVYRNGTVCSDPAVDPVVGMSINPTPPDVAARIVDLDSEQQGVSELWGFTVALGQPKRTPAFAGDFAVAAFADLSTRVSGAGQGDSVLGASFQSVLQNIKWANLTGSRFLEDLTAGGRPAQLSIKFNVDGFNDTMGTAGFTTGRVVGSIGPYVQGEPKYFVAGRVLPPTGNSPFNTSYAEIHGEVLTLDLGNSLPTESSGGPLADIGPLSLALLPAEGAPVSIGPIDYTAPGWYPRTAGIVSFHLTPDQAKLAATTPLGLVPTGGLGSQAFLAEPAGGLWLRADSYVFRLDPGETAGTTLYATTFGRRTAGLKVSLGYDASIMQGQTKQGPISGPSVVGQPESALTFPGSITTGPDGTCDLTLTAGDPGNPREYIDGQVYGVIYGPADDPPVPGTITNSSLILSALVHTGYEIPKVPTWADVQPIFQEYANLYPVMRPIVDLSNYESVYEMRHRIKSVFSVPMTDPRYMPVTRDLSKAKREMILRWLDNPIRNPTTPT